MEAGDGAYIRNDHPIIVRFFPQDQPPNEQRPYEELAMMEFIFQFHGQEGADFDVMEMYRIPPIQNNADNNENIVNDHDGNPDNLGNNEVVNTAAEVGVSQGVEEDNVLPGGSRKRPREEDEEDLEERSSQRFRWWDEFADSSSDYDSDADSYSDSDVAEDEAAEEKTVKDNEKLLADNEKLLADNEKLLADSETLLADNEKLLADNEDEEEQGDQEDQEEEVDLQLGGSRKRSRQDDDGQDDEEEDRRWRKRPKH